MVVSELIHRNPGFGGKVTARLENGQIQLKSSGWRPRGGIESWEAPAIWSDNYVDLLPGEVVRFPSVPGLKVPHMGWNQLRLRQAGPFLNGVADGADVYFVHSYYAVPADPSLTAAETDYPMPFTAAVGRASSTSP